MVETIKTILVIDDEKSIRQSIVDYLEDSEFIAIQAENGAKGLEMFQEHQPDLVFTDLRMPELDGIEVITYICEHSPETPIIVISGTGNIGDSVEALRAGAWDYIIKPIHDSSIISLAIDRAGERARLLKENRAYQENLEKLVQERTHELQLANSQLSEINLRLRKIIGSTGELAKCSDVQRFGSTLLNEFTGQFAATGGSLFFIEDKGLRLIFTKEPNRVPEFIPFPLAEGSVLKKALEGKEPLLINDIKHHEEINHGGWKEYSNNSVLVFPLPDENGQIIGILTLHDKTSPPFVEQDREIGSILVSFSRETLRAIQNLETIRVNAEQQRTILNSLQIGIMVVNPENHSIVDANSEAIRLIGISEDKIIGQECSKFLCRDKRSGCLPNNCSEQKNNSESVLTSTNRGEIPISKTVVPIQLNGKLHILESFIDISANKEMELEKEKLEAQLVQAQKMEAVGTLAGGLAHDLNNALNGIVSPVSMLLHKIGNDDAIDENKLIKYLNGIQRSSFHIADMVNQLMTVSQKHELVLTNLDLNNSIKHVVKLTKSTFDKSIEVNSVLYHSPATTNADPTQIEQVILNLMINAAHSMTIMRKENETWGGKLDISIDLIPADKAVKAIQSDIAAGDYWVITVKDTGIGILEENLTKIFTPFYTSKEKDQGTGLGLAMVFSIVKQHKGFITVDSFPGKGSIFYLYLPQVLARSSKKEYKPDYSLLKGSGLILIVDDEAIIRDSVMDILKEFGYQTVEAEDGLAALEVLEKQSKEIDLILLDLIMPRMAGDETFKKLKQHYPHIPVILTSGFKQDKRIQSIFNSADVEFLQKPFDMYALAASVKKNIGKNKGQLPGD